MKICDVSPKRLLNVFLDVRNQVSKSNVLFFLHLSLTLHPYNSNYVSYKKKKNTNCKSILISPTKSRQNKFFFFYYKRY